MIAATDANLEEAALSGDWPGNVRQLHNVARQFVALTQAGRRPTSSAALTRLFVGGDEGPTHPSSPPRTWDGGERARPARGLARIDDAVLMAALQHNRWIIDATAGHLGISKTSL